MLRKVIIGAIIAIVLVIAFNLVTQIINTIKSGDRLSVQAEIVYSLEAKNREL